MADKVFAGQELFTEPTKRLPPCAHPAVLPIAFQRAATWDGNTAHSRVSRSGVAAAAALLKCGLLPEAGNALSKQALLVGDRQETTALRCDVWALILKDQGDLS
jgi:hypothetical protein